MKIMKVKIGNKILRIKDCRGFSSIRGLMFDPMKGYDGALIYSNAVWMPFVKHKLTLVFLGKRFATTSIQYAVPMTLHPRTWKIYKDEKATHCLELKDMPGLSVTKTTRINLLKALNNPSPK